VMRLSSFLLLRNALMKSSAINPESAGIELNGAKLSIFGRKVLALVETPFDRALFYLYRLALRGTSSRGKSLLGSIPSYTWRTLRVALLGVIFIRRYVVTMKVEDDTV
jgi:hypothetical protein